ncbi:hypothetical protein Tco_0535203 [Tanacetum coccineum]
MALGYQNPFYLKKGYKQREAWHGDMAKPHAFNHDLKKAQQKQQSLYNGKVLLEKHDPPAVYDSEETLQLAQESHLKMIQLNKEIKLANYTKINHLLGVFVSQTAKSREELYFSNTSKTANVSKPISIPNEEFSDDTTPSVARKFLNEVKSTIVTLQRVVKQKMTLDIHNWSSSVHQEIHKIVKDEIFPIVNQVDARLQNFKIQFLKEAAKFVRDFKSLAKEADESLAKHKALEFEIEHLLRVVVSQDIMSIVQSNSVVDTSNLQTELERAKERFENSYNDMQQKIERLQAQLGDQKGKSKDTQFVSNTLDPLSHKLENENLRAQLFDKVSEQKEISKGTSANTKFANQSTMRKPSLQSLRNKFVMRQPNAFQSEHQNFSKLRVPQKVDETNALSNPVTSNSTSREDKFVSINKVRASVRINPITVSQPHVITKNHVNYDSHGLSSTGVDNIAKTRRPQPQSNTKNDRVPFASKSSYIKNKEVEVEEHHRNLLLSKNKKPMSSECNNVKLAIQNDKSKVVCAMCQQCLITANHDVCVLNYVNGMNSHGKKQKVNALNVANQKKHKPTIRKPNKVIQICLWCIDSGCSKHMTGNLKLLINFFWKFLGTVHFRNYHVVVILGYGDLQWGNILITRVYFVEGLCHNLFSVGQFCDSDLEVTFRRNTYFVINLKGVDLLKGNCTANLYTINLHEMAAASPICLMAHATSTKSWL